MNNKLIDQKNAIELEKTKIDKKYNIIAAFRLLIFLLAVILLFISVSNRNTPLLIAAVVCLAVFVFLVKMHGDLDDELLGLKSKTNVIERFIKRNAGGWKTFKDDGSQFLKNSDNLSYDLDLLGKNSLFQLINVAHTFEGKKRLAETLSLKRDNSSKLQERYEAVKELTDNAEFILDFESTSERIVDRREKEYEKQAGFLGSDIDDIQKKDDEKDKKAKDATFPGWMYLLMILIPLMNIINIVMVLSGRFKPGRIVIVFLIGLIVSYALKPQTELIINPVYKYGTSAKDYHKLLSLIAKMEFKSNLLKSIVERINSRDGLLQAIKDIWKIGIFYNISYNPIVHMVLSGFLGWDFFIAFAASRWSKKNSGVFDECIDIIAQIEELQSLAVLSLVRKTVQPKVHFDTDLKLDVKKIYHPLLDVDTVVSNSAELSNKLTVITGSNMSGKTTFLRTVAINMVLAYTGAGVCAEHFNVPFMKIFTSMRVMDDVSGGISTFYAEILRIKEMAEYTSAGNEVPALCLIDEIFKGTNSADRLVGAEQALKKLSSGNSMVLVSTHDFELCDIKTEDGTEADNYHFEEYYENNNLKFDYTIKDGRCTTRNAIAILKMAGLVQN